MPLTLSLLFYVAIFYLSLAIKCILLEYAPIMLAFCCLLLPYNYNKQSLFQENLVYPYKKGFWTNFSA